MNEFSRIIRVALVFVSGVFLVGSIVLNLLLRENLDNNVTQNLEKDTEIISVEVSRFLSSYSEVVNVMSTNDILLTYVREVETVEDKEGHPLYQDVLKELTKIVDMYDDVRLTWVGMNSINDFLNYNPQLKYEGSEYTYFERPWYIAMVEADGAVGVSPIFHDIRDSEPVISIVKPIMNLGEENSNVNKNIGQVAMDLSMKDLSNYIAEYKIGETGFAVLLDNNGEIVSSPEHIGLIEDLINQESENSEADEVYLNKKLGTRKVIINQEEYYQSVSPVGIGDWYVGTFIKVSEYNDQLIYVNLFTTVIVLAIIIIVISMFIMVNLRSKEAYIRKMAYLDPLTEINNRRGLIEAFEEKLGNNYSGAIMMLDLDNFKEINDTMGHMVGDKLLKEIAGYLEDQFGDKTFVARFGGDEFLLLLDSESVGEVEAFAKTIVDGFDMRFNINTEFHVTFSMGIALYPYHSTDVNELISYADATMYFVKHHGKNNFALFDEQMVRAMREKVSIEKYLREALANDGFHLAYQPKLDLNSKRIAGVEGLIRLKNHPISPAKFIAVAEEQGLIIEIGRWVVEEAIRFIAKLHERGIDDIPVAINFSPKQLVDTEFMNFIHEKLNLYGVQPEYLHIEVTENVLMSNLEEAEQLVAQFHGAGIKLALDDFGTGFSSISYLTVMDVDYLKLDKLLSDQFLTTEDLSTIKSIIDLGHSLNITVIAEGVETIEQFEALKKVGCDQIQGYYYARPMSEEQMIDFYRTK